jgi:hypothetical protein
MKMRVSAIVGLILCAYCACFAEEPATALRVGRAGHAFDHLGSYGNQAEAAAASGATIIYTTGLGGVGYSGLPPAADFEAQRAAITKYNRDAKSHGIELAIGYICATSIVKLDEFDKNWSNELRARFKTPPAEWRQQDRKGQPLASWYGGDYNPACMNNPDWRAYEEYIVQQQLESGHDGVFFDNPTVHPQGCYCPHCMAKFVEFIAPAVPAAKGELTIDEQRELADAHPKEFLLFRAKIGRDFLAHMRRFARTIKPDALVTCNNSLNSPDRMYAQCRMHGYNIFEMSQAEDLVVVEDMVAQPRTEANGRTIEYGSTYKQLHAISHGKPVVAVTLAEGDYYTPPNLVRLAMSEAAANGASYLSWPTWPEDQRQRMIAAVRPQADFLRQHEALLNDSTARADVLLFLPFRRWVEVEKCTASELAAALSAANIQYEVFTEEQLDLSPRDGQLPVLVVESLGFLTSDESDAIEKFKAAGGRVVTADQDGWLEQVKQSLDVPSLQLTAPATVRATLRDQPNRTIVHLLNLNVQRLSSFEDRVTPANDITLRLRVPFDAVRDVTIHTADEHGTSGPLVPTIWREGNTTGIELKVPRLDVSAILVIDG